MSSPVERQPLLRVEGLTKAFGGIRAVDRALACAVPEIFNIFNSDQGSYFTSTPYTSRLLAAGTRISMDGRGRVFDNG